MSSGVVPFGSFDLNKAYNKGNVINQNIRDLPSGVGHLEFHFGHDPVIIAQTTPGAGSRVGHDLLQSLLDCGIMCSGYSLTPHLTDTFAFSAIGPGFISLQGSGLPHSEMMLATGGGFSILSGSSDMVISANGSLTINQNGGNGDILIENKGGNIRLSPFDGSGQLEYRFGSMGLQTEGLYVRPSYSNQFLLIPNINEVINIARLVVSGII